MIALVHADQPSYYPGLTLSILSLRRHNPELPLLVSCPGAPADYLQWVREHAAEVYTDAIDEACGWNVKPHLILRALDEGHDEVLWLDADIIVTGSVRDVLAGDARILSVAEEPAFGQRQGSRARVEGWQLEPGRDLPITTNTAVLKVSSAHRRLLTEWLRLLGRADYLAAQAMPATQRPLHMLGDQDVLCALLGSRAFAGLPVRTVRRGSEIAQCGAPSDFLVSERLRSMRTGTPVFVHSPRAKPWHKRQQWRYSGGRMARLRTWYEDLHLDLSPYTIAAREYATIAVPCEPAVSEPMPYPSWMRLTHAGTRPQLPELPLAAFDQVVRAFRARAGIGRFRLA